MVLVSINCILRDSSCFSSFLDGYGVTASNLIHRPGFFLPATNARIGPSLPGRLSSARQPAGAAPEPPRRGFLAKYALENGQGFVDLVEIGKRERHARRAARSYGSDAGGALVGNNGIVNLSGAEILVPLIHEVVGALNGNQAAKLFYRLG